MKDLTKHILAAVSLVAVAVGTSVWLTSDGALTNRTPMLVAARALPQEITPTPGQRSSPSRTKSANDATPAQQPELAANSPQALPLIFGRRWHSSSNGPAFTQFADWIDRYQAARTAAERTTLTAEGVQLATDRRTAMSNLIREAPEDALDLAVPFEGRIGLPPEVTSLLEQPVSGKGTLAVFGALAEPGHEAEVRSVFRTATLDGHEYDAYVYGRRLGEPTRWNIPMNGVALDRLLAISANPLRVLSAAEAATITPAKNDAICAVSGNSTLVNNTPTAAQVGGQFVRLCGLGHADELNAQLVQADGGTGSGPDGDVQASSYTEGVKRLLVIRVDFADLAGDPFPTNTGVSLISGLNDFYRESSYGRTGFYLNGSGSSVTPTLRLSNTAAYYGTNNYYSQLQNDARAAALAAGFNPSNYDFDLTCFGAVPGWSWAGLGWVGANGVWLRSYFTAGVAGHELGHNYGLNHANYWDTSGSSVIGTGTSVEYGDVFDTMGSASAGANHFNARYKSYLNWLTTADVQTVTNSGTYRIYAHDDTNSTGLRALRIPRNSNTNFWVEYRQKFTGNAWMMNGAGLRWAGNGNQRSDLLDTTPGSPNGKNDSALVVGRTFSDFSTGIHITTLRRAGTSPDALDIAVNIGTFPGNHRPAISVAGSSTASIGGTVGFTASANDSDGDTLAYYWDFGDGTFGTNGAAASKSWGAAGEYVVQCTASDMKGGVAVDSMVVTVGSPATYRITGQVTIGGSPVAGARVSVSASRVTYTDSDGSFALVGLPASSYTVSAAVDGYTMVPSGFANPVSVGPNASGINFIASGVISVTMTSPTNNSSFAGPSSIALAANASPSSGNSLTKVEFYQGSTKLGEDTTAPYSFTWSNPLPGNYSLTSIARDSGGQSVTSAPVAISVVATAPVIASNPQSTTVASGGTASFAVTANGAGPLAYQWWKDSSAIPGATNSTLQLSSVTGSDAADYSVVVTNSYGSATSSPATLTVLLPPGIISQPVGQSVGVGASVTISVTASGSAPLRYQWRKNGAVMNGSTNSSIQFNPATLSDSADYTVVITNSVGSVTSAAATLTVQQAPTITAQPQSQTVAAGANVTLAVTASGTGPLYYQWLKDGLTVGGANSNSLRFPSIASTDSGNYVVWITNSMGAVTSSIAALNVQCSVALSASLASFTAAGGNGSVTITTHSSCGWTVANVPAWLSLTSPSSGSGTATLTYTVSSNSTGSSRSGTLDITGQSYQVSQLPSDSNPPSLTITDPAADTTVSETTIQLQGTATDNVGVTSVEFRVGANAYSPAVGTTSWTATAGLVNGTNTISVRASDGSGNISIVQQRVVVCVDPGTILLSVNGHGAVKGATNGQHLKIGKAYSLTAVAADGYAFSNWTGSVSTHASRVDFVMGSNVQFTANFVPNPFVACKGVFNGLFYETNQVSHDRSGFFSLAMTDKGTFTASVLTRGLKLKSKGTFDLLGRATNVVSATDGSTYTIVWAVALDGSDMISGVVSSGAWSAPLAGDRLVYHPKTNAAPQAGHYTFAVLGNPTQSDAPGGDGYGTLKVDTKGTALLSGYLADQTRFVVRAPLSRLGNSPVYASLYGNKGSVLGWVAFRDRPTTDLDGVLSWTRPAIANSLLYPLGFTSESALIGSAYQTPAAGQPIFTPLAPPTFRFNGGNLSSGFTNNVAFNGASIVNLTANALSCVVSPASGLFTGIVTPPSGIPSKVAFKGAILQKAGLGSGYFLGTNQTGQVVLDGQP